MATSESASRSAERLDDSTGARHSGHSGFSGSQDVKHEEQKTCLQTGQSKEVAEELVREKRGNGGSGKMCVIVVRAWPIVRTATQLRTRILSAWAA